MEEVSIYVHWPFCESKCPYCDFNSHVASGLVDHSAWCKMYLAELEVYLNHMHGTRLLRSVFFGGGTPSLMDPGTADSLLSFILQHPNIRYTADLEVTLEANPSSFEVKKFKAFKSAGVNRVSLGVQALNDNDLKLLGRHHDLKDAIRAIDSARNIFNNYSFDLIYARPGQTLSSWEKELGFALRNFADNHLSLYVLTIEKGTPFYAMHKRGELVVPDDESFYSLTNRMTSGEGIVRYEVSNYARRGFECRHNLAYWQALDYIGVGPGAHGRIKLNSKVNKAGFARYITVNYCLPAKYMTLMRQFASQGGRSNVTPLSQGAEKSSSYHSRRESGLEGVRRPKFVDRIGRRSGVRQGALAAAVSMGLGGVDMESEVSKFNEKSISQNFFGGEFSPASITSFVDGDGAYQGSASGLGLPCQTFRPIELREQVQEILIMSLRTKSGFSPSEIRGRLGVDIKEFLDWNNVVSLRKDGLLEAGEGESVRVTDKGMNVSDSVAKFLMPYSK